MGQQEPDASIAQEEVRRADATSGITKPVNGLTFRQVQWLRHDRNACTETGVLRWAESQKSAQTFKYLKEATHPGS
jgi:hypothetical protein